MKRRTYLTGLASVSAIATIGATGATAAPGDGEDVLVVDDGTGDSFGAGDLVHPTNDDFYDGVWDITQFRLGEDDSRIYFDFEMAALENAFVLPSGWSHEYFQVYIRDPNADSSAPTAETGLSDALNVSFQEPYQYVLLAHGNDYQALLDADGNETVSPADTTVSVEGTTISVSVPKDNISDVSALELAVLVTPYDGNNSDSGYMRTIVENPDEYDSGDYLIGGGDSSTPRVMDMITPDGVSQSDALARPDGSGNPTLSYVSASQSSGPDVPDVGDNTPGNLDDDDLLEDVDGDGDGDVDDVMAYYENRKSDAVRNNPDSFDFDGDGTAGTVSDALELYEQLTN